MSREIKFRAWDKGEKQYYYDAEHTYDFQCSGKGCLSESFGEVLEQPERFVVEQYTGLKDKNGKEIYEGDIVKFDCGDQTPAEVVYQEGSYFIKALDDGTLFYDPDANKPCPLGWLEAYGLEVIGNIHENPELLEEKND